MVASAGRAALEEEDRDQKPGVFNYLLGKLGRPLRSGSRGSLVSHFQSTLAGAAPAEQESPSTDSGQEPVEEAYSWKPPSEHQLTEKEVTSLPKSPEEPRSKAGRKQRTRVKQHLSRPREGLTEAVKQHQEEHRDETKNAVEQMSEQVSESNSMRTVEQHSQANACAPKGDLHDLMVTAPAVAVTREQRPTAEPLRYSNSFDSGIASRGASESIGEWDFRRTIRRSRSSTSRSAQEFRRDGSPAESSDLTSGRQSVKPNAESKGQDHADSHAALQLNTAFRATSIPEEGLIPHMSHKKRVGSSTSTKRRSQDSRRNSHDSKRNSMEAGLETDPSLQPPRKSLDLRGPMKTSKNASDFLPAELVQRSMLFNGQME